MPDLSELGSARPIHAPDAHGPKEFPYDGMVAMANEIQKHDPTFTFAGLRPVYDELWNLMNGQRTLEAIRDAICFQFDVEIPQRTIDELVAQLVDSGRVILNQ